MTSKIGAGRLYERIAFEKPVQQPDGQGGMTNGWKQQFECRAHFHLLRGSETVQASRLQGQQPVIVTIRASSDARQIEPGWRIKDVRSGTIYQVKEPPRLTEDRAYFQMLAMSGVAG